MSVPFMDDKGHMLATVPIHISMICLSTVNIQAPIKELQKPEKDGLVPYGECH